MFHAKLAAHDLESRHLAAVITSRPNGIRESVVGSGVGVFSVVMLPPVTAMSGSPCAQSALAQVALREDPFVLIKMVPPAFVKLEKDTREIL